MSLSTDPDYLAKYGVRAVGGPLNDQIVDDGALLVRTIRFRDGFYHLKGSADGGLAYVWGGVAAVDEGPAEGRSGDD